MTSDEAREMLSAVSLRWGIGGMGIFMEAAMGGERGSEPESLSPDMCSDWYVRSVEMR